MKLREQRLIKIEESFIDKISGLFIVKMLDEKAQSILMLKIKFVRNSTTLDVTNISLEMVIFSPEEMLRILDIRSIGYYKIKHGVLRQNLSKYFIFEFANVHFDQFNKFVNTLRKKKGKQLININC